MSIAVLASLASPLHAVAAASGGMSTGDPGLPCASPLLAGPVGGAAAIKELGADLPLAAAKIDRSPAEYRALLRSDRTMRVDECGMTFAVDPAMTTAEKAATASAEEAPISANAPLDSSGDAFLLNSRPGSKRTIYLDFNGALISGTAWNTGYHPGDVLAPGYDSDGDAATFSAAELDVVRSTWLRVSEDYAPFDVNVTTQDPGSAAIDRSSLADLVFGTRALITTDLVLWQAICGQGCGGVAYVGVFDDAFSHASAQPALIWVGGTGTGAKGVAEAATHEVGHNLGLSHDGKTGAGATSYYAGQGVWAPIMGVGYYKPVAQWSPGDYSGANNLEDDLAVMAGNGVSLMADDHANSAVGATALTYGGSATDGLISTRTDTDWFTFTVPAGAADTAVRVSTQGVSPNLDAAITLYDNAGAVMTVVDPPVAMSSGDLATGLSATLTQTLLPGTYRAKVDGVGFGDRLTTGYSDYDSLGRYTISAGDAGTPTPPPPPPPPPPLPVVWSGTLSAAVTKLTVRTETATGYSAARFPLVDADHDCRKIRDEVLKSESLHKVRWKNARHCVVVHGQWFSTFDRHTVKRGPKTSVIWMVPLSEAWQSGASSWSTTRRQAYANDLTDSRTLRAVTAASARARADREPTGWLPSSASRCNYVAEWVAVKLRWGLAINSAEHTRLASLAAGCSSTRLTVHRT